MTSILLFSNYLSSLFRKAIGNLFIKLIFFLFYQVKNNYFLDLNALLFLPSFCFQSDFFFFFLRFILTAF